MEDKSLVFQEVWTTPRKSEIRARRKTDAELDAVLTEDQVRAKEEINKYFTLITSGLMTGAINPDRVSGGGQADWSEATILAVKEFRSWANGLDRLHYAITLDVCVFGFSARDTADMRCKSTNTVMKYLRESLHSYCVVKGWVKDIIH